MEERQVTAAGQTYSLDQPSFVLATQNPIELEGTYPLPEAQLDRFLLNPVINFLSLEDEIKMVAETTGAAKAPPQAVLDGAGILDLQEITRDMPVSEHVVSYAVRLATASRPGAEGSDEWIEKRVKWGAGSRASQALILSGKALALLDGRPTVACEDIKAMAKPAFRHRILPSFFSDSEGTDSDDIVDYLLEEVPETA
jgi:MoxR-like ATPase